ncbi:prohead protease/major capsid protein fusion protein [Deefgea piscis]|uniref:prohead protease/major capsid protein fusion protein n=1 Tax=Deefgea piscis TaxID=2739061 RepID=UPI001C80B0F0|nr:prohead protease/major capsid protein fusion protein [Deefgea piscis]QZA80188.1 HK97 family phage prohead protease [Deefgea piscis]
MPKTTLPLATRAAPVSSVNAETRTITLVWTTGAGVRRYDWCHDRYYQELLDVTPEAIDLTRLNNGAPLLNTHSSWDLSDIVGVVERAWIENGEGLAEVRFSERPELEGLWKDVQSGVIRNVSVGYSVDRLQMTQDDAGNWIYRAVGWTPHEISLVPIPADAGCGTRSEKTEGIREYPVEIIERTADVGRDEGQQITADPVAVNTASADFNQRSEENMTPEQIAAAAAEKRAADEALVKQERARAAEINTQVRSVGLDQAIADDLIERGVSADAAAKEVLAKLAERSNANPIRTPRVETLADETDIRREAIAASVMHRAGQLKDLPDTAREFRGFTLPELARYSLEKQGIDVRGLSRPEIVQRSLMGTTDFSIALGNAVGRVLRGAYEAAPKSFERWARKGNLTDFRPSTRVTISSAAQLERVGEHGEIKQGFLNDAGEQIQLASYAKKIGITRQVIINDDLDVFGRIPLAFANGALQMESQMVYGILTGNPVMADGVALFHASRGNLAGAGSAISVAALAAGRAAMRLQKDPTSKEPLNLLPSFLIVPAGKETEAEQFLAQITANTSGGVNPFAKSLELIVEPRLDATSAVSWYLAANPGLVDTVEYAYLEGAEGLQIFTRDAFSSGNDFEGVEVMAREDFATKAIDFRGLYRNPGA